MEHAHYHILREIERVMDKNEVTSLLVGVSLKQTPRLLHAAWLAQRRGLAEIKLAGVHTGQTFLLRGRVVSKSAWYRHKAQGFAPSIRESYMLQLRNTYMSPFAYTVS